MKKLTHVIALLTATASLLIAISWVLSNDASFESLVTTTSSFLTLLLLFGEGR